MRKTIIFSVFLASLVLSYTAYGDGINRNPFSFETGKPRGNNGLGKPDNLQGLKIILIQGDLKIALIDGKKYFEGDGLDNGVITRITLNSVTMEKNGVEKVYRLKGAR